MFYAILGYLHAALWRANVAVTRRARAIHALAEERGQGTVEYVGLILLVSLLMVGMVAAMKGFNSYLTKGGYYRARRTMRAAVTYRQSAFSRDLQIRRRSAPCRALCSA